MLLCWKVTKLKCISVMLQVLSSSPLLSILGNPELKFEIYHLEANFKSIQV